VTATTRQPAGARGCVPQGRGSAENAADHPDAWVPLPGLRHVSVVRSPVVRSPVVSWLARSPASHSSHRSPACIAAIWFPRNSILRLHPEHTKEQKRTERNTRILIELELCRLPPSTIFLVILMLILAVVFLRASVPPWFKTPSPGSAFPNSCLLSPFIRPNPPKSTHTKSHAMKKTSPFPLLSSPRPVVRGPVVLRPVVRGLVVPCPRGLWTCPPIMEVKITKRTQRQTAKP
jgi:hypothetical protein